MKLTIPITANLVSVASIAPPPSSGSSELRDGIGDTREVKTQAPIAATNGAS